MNSRGRKQVGGRDMVAPTVPDLTKNESSLSSFSSEVTFDSLPIHPATKRALAEDFKYKTLSAPQATYLPDVLSMMSHQSNVFVLAGTGTGKTIGFLLPVIEALIANKSRQAPGAIGALIMSPSRELAQQTRDEATRLLRFHEGMAVQLVMGGGSVDRERKALKRDRCDILVATPGRLLDHIENSTDVDMRAKLAGVKVLVLDEADEMMNMGFERDLRAILSTLPATRWTLLFSATYDDRIKKVASDFAPGFKTLVARSDRSIDQRVCVIEDFGKVLEALVAFLVKVVVEDGERVIVFWTNANLTHFAAQLLGRVKSLRGRVLEIHSRLSQSERNRAASDFRDNSGRVLFASDVISRGLDFPDVAAVLQVGITDRAKYEHRTGRTGRGGRHGQALLMLLADEEQLLTKELKDVRELIKLDLNSRALSEKMMKLEPELAYALSQVSQDAKLSRAARDAYISTLGFYSSNARRVLGWRPADIVANVNKRFSAMGLNQPPAIKRKTAKQMNLADAPGLRIE